MSQTLSGRSETVYQDPCQNSECTLPSNPDSPTIWLLDLGRTAKLTARIVPYTYLHTYLLTKTAARHQSWVFIVIDSQRYLRK